MLLAALYITQSSAVWELHDANPELGRVGLYRAAMCIGRDHVGSAVNTLALACARASLPLLVLLSTSPTGFIDTLTIEQVAAEVLRTLVGSIGLIGSVPLTSGLAATIVTHSRPGEVSLIGSLAPTMPDRTEAREQLRHEREARRAGFERGDDDR